MKNHSESFPQAHDNSRNNQNSLIQNFLSKLKFISVLLPMDLSLIYKGVSATFIHYKCVLVCCSFETTFICGAHNWTLLAGNQIYHEIWSYPSSFDADLMTLFAMKYFTRSLILAQPSSSSNFYRRSKKKKMKVKLKSTLNFFATFRLAFLLSMLSFVASWISRT